MTTKQTTLDEALKVHNAISEFTDSYDKTTFEERLKGKKQFILVAYEKNNPVGYLVAYAESPTVIYYWMGAVIPTFRKTGVMTAMMDKMFEIAKKNRYEKITVKTRNDKRGMLTNFIKRGYNFTRVEPKENINDSEIFLEKNLEY